ncbi:hypothetical protein L2D37_26545 [Vibrio harveyi]|uniref:hypothetical protein n=1 Tax=Vibrio harveyi TaxID=669 RepID=UPI003BB6029C
MAVVYYFILLAFIPVLLLPWLKNKNFWVGVIVTLIGAGQFYHLGTYKSCASGWRSPSIGTRGACSHHGGVVSNMNELGYIIIVVALVYLLFFCLRSNKTQKGSQHKTQEQANEQLPCSEPSFDDFKKYITTWYRNGLSVEEIVAHLASKNVTVSESEIRELLRQDN